MHYLRRLSGNVYLRTEEQQQEIQCLRGLEISPKMIARQLGLRPAEVSDVIRQQAIQTVEERRERGELEPLHECLVDIVVGGLKVHRKTKRFTRPRAAWRSRKDGDFQALANDSFSWN
jgi:hypothetical protein